MNTRWAMIFGQRLQSERAAYLSNMTFGVLFGLLALMGVGNQGNTNLFGLVHISGADNWLHVLLAVAMIGAAMGAHRSHKHANVH